MARYKQIDTQPKFLPVDLARQLLPGTFEHAVHHLVEHAIDLSPFDQRFRNDATGAPAYLLGFFSLGLVMLENGDDPAKVTDESFDRALAVIQKAQDAGQIRRFYGNDYAQPLSTGDLAASMAWSGDILNLGDPKLKWVIPEKGGIIWTDNMLIPTGGSVPTASTYMNFVYDPNIAAQLSLGANYISSVKGVPEEAAKLNPDAAANTLAFPTDDMLSQMHQNDPAMLTNPDYEKRWLAVQGK